MGRLLDIAVAIPTEMGSRQLVWAALGEEGNPDKLRGEYISLQRIEEVSDYILSPEGRARKTKFGYVVVGKSALT